MTRQDFRNLPNERFTLDEQIKELIYELALRENAYPRFIEQNRMKQADAIWHYLALRAALRTLLEVRANNEEVLF